jgi:UDP-glucose-4-epimerase GalE
VGGSIRLLETLLDCGVRRVIFSSTCATYGLPQNLPIDETAPQHPVNPYGESKLFVEKMLRWYGEAYGLQWMALRYFNAAGADPDGDLGEEHDPETHLIPCAIEAALHRRPYLEVFGMDYETPDGTAIRDFTHVSDLARAHLLSLAYLRGGGQSGALNLGTGKGHSVLEVVQAVAATCGRKPPLRSRPRRAGDPAQLVSDPTQAEKALGWKAAFTDLRSIVGTAYRWHSGQGAAARSAAAN